MRSNGSSSPPSGIVRAMAPIHDICCNQHRFATPPRRQRPPPSVLAPWRQEQRPTLPHSGACTPPHSPACTGGRTAAPTTTCRIHLTSRPTCRPILSYPILSRSHEEGSQVRTAGKAEEGQRLAELLEHCMSKAGTQQEESQMPPHSVCGSLVLPASLSPSPHPPSHILSYPILSWQPRAASHAHTY